MSICRLCVGLAKQCCQIINMNPDRCVSEKGNIIINIISISISRMLSVVFILERKQIILLIKLLVSSNLNFFICPILYLEDFCCSVLYFSRWTAVEQSHTINCREKKL